MLNPYQLHFPARFALALSVLEFTLDEALDTPYRLTVAVTSANGELALATLIDQPVTFTVAPALGMPALSLPGLGTLATGLERTRSWHGVVRQASRGRSTREETLYTFEIGPRISRLADGKTTRLFQNATTAQVIEAVLRQHDLNGADFSFTLTDAQPSYAHITQFRESDLAFISRIAAHAGMFYQFTQSKDGKDVVAFGNNLEHYTRGNLNGIALREHAGLESVGVEAVTAFSIRHGTMLQGTRRRNFNYMTASQSLDGSAGFGGDTPAAHGVDYEWGEGHRDPDETERVATIRHQLSVSRQCQASGSGNVLLTRPGEVLRLNRPFAEALHGWLITAVSHHGRRDQAYANHFQAIPADRVWRPALLPKPRIHGTLPAMVVSPGDNSYQYPFLDEQGRYRVRFLFDLDKWNPGGDSRAVRLAKPFAGGGFGFHLPLHAGTRVNLGFDDGDPDEPYIASVMHDSSRSDHIDSGWNTRNVILTRSHNKLRMEDLQGKEHIKLATEYGKTQLNIGHLVDASRQQRGEGFELRTDQWGAIRAGKGLLISAHGKAGASGGQKDMEQAIGQLDNANNSSRAMNEAAKTANADLVDLQAQTELLKQQVKSLQDAVLLATAPAGIALSTAQHMHLSAGQSLAINTGQNMGLTILKNLAINVGEAISFFALKTGIKLFANKGPIQIQAQSDALQLAAQQDLSITSSNGKVTIGAKEIMLAAGGSWVRLGSDGLHLGSAGEIKHFGHINITDPQGNNPSLPQFAKASCKTCLDKGFAEANPLVGAHA